MTQARRNELKKLYETLEWTKKELKKEKNNNQKLRLKISHSKIKKLIYERN